jgi:hypothetical protein
MSKTTVRRGPKRKGFHVMLPQETIGEINRRVTVLNPQWAVVKSAIDATKEAK